MLLHSVNIYTTDKIRKVCTKKKQRFTKLFQCKYSLTYLRVENFYYAGCTHSVNEKIKFTVVSRKNLELKLITSPPRVQISTTGGRTPIIKLTLLFCSVLICRVIIIGVSPLLVEI